MLNPSLTRNVIASLQSAGITPPKLPSIRQLPKPSGTVEELTELVLASKHENPYEDPRVVACAAQLYLSGLSHLTQGHHHREQVRQAEALEAHKDSLLEQIREAFDTAAANLQASAESVKGITDPSTIDPRTSSRQASAAAANVAHDIMTLERIIKAWSDLWAALGASTPRDVARPFIFINPNAQTWTDGLNRNPTIWEAVRNGEPLTLADTPRQANDRYSAMWDNKQAALDEVQESFHRKNGAAMLKAFRS